MLSLVLNHPVSATFLFQSVPPPPSWRQYSCDGCLPLVPTFVWLEFFNCLESWQWYSSHSYPNPVGADAYQSSEAVLLAVSESICQMKFFNAGVD